MRPVCRHRRPRQERPRRGRRLRLRRRARRSLRRQGRLRSRVWSWSRQPRHQRPRQSLNLHPHRRLRRPSPQRPERRSDRRRSSSRLLQELSEWARVLYTVALSVLDAARLSTVALTLTFDPMLLRVRGVQEGSFMRLGGADATFTQQAAPGRVDITITRSGDATGATGTGLLAAVVFEPVAAGTAMLTLSGSGTGPGGTAMSLQFRPVTVTIQQ